MSRKVRGTKQLTTRRFIRGNLTDGVIEGFTTEGETDEVEGLYLGLLQSGNDVTFDSAEGFGKLECVLKVAAFDPVPYTWEIVSNEEHRSILELPDVVAMGADDIQLIQDKLNASSASDRDAVDLSTTGDPALAAIVYDRLSNKSDFVYDSNPVLRKTITVHDGDQIPALSQAYADTKKIWSAAALADTETMPAWAASVITFYETSHDTTLSGYTWGWLKKVPSITQRWGQKVEFTQEWWGANWDTELRYDIHAFP